MEILVGAANGSDVILNENTLAHVDYGGIYALRKLFQMRKEFPSAV